MIHADDLTERERPTGVELMSPFLSTVSDERQRELIRAAHQERRRIHDDEIATSPGKGIVIGMILGASFWALFLFVCWLATR